MGKITELVRGHRCIQGITGQKSPLKWYGKAELANVADFLWDSIGKRGLRREGVLRYSWMEATGATRASHIRAHSKREVMQKQVLDEGCGKVVPVKGTTCMTMI